MKATLTFNLDDPQERLAHKRALNGTNAYIAFFTIMNDTFRKRIKYGELDFDSENLVVEMQQEIIATMENYEINLNDLE
jgi:hypothetical protein